MPSLPGKLDQQFVEMLTIIEQQYRNFNRHIQIRVQKWVEQLVQCDQNLVWKKSRNLYIELLHQMVQRKWVGAMFLRMPPTKGIPNLKESQFKMIMQEVKSHPKQTVTWKHNELAMKKVIEPLGDAGTSSNTPLCVTDRKLLHEQKIFYHQASTIRQAQDGQHNLDSFEPEQLLQNSKQKYFCNLGLFMERFKNSFNEDQQYLSILSELRNVLGWKNRNPQKRAFSQSFQLQVEEGIEKNKMNLFQFGSPRGMTQMQYFKATLQL